MFAVPFLTMNIIAFCSFLLIFITFLAAKKTQEIVSFMGILATLIVWAGASILMRLQVVPGVNFWFYVSLIALFIIALTCYLFVKSFVHEKGIFSSAIWTVLTLVIVALTPTGIFLNPPTPETLEDGTVVFRYSVPWTIVIPLVLLLCIVVATARILALTVKRKGLHCPGLPGLIIGCVVMALGNMLSILPGNVFPWDMLSGIVCAVLLCWALYKKHLFHLTLLVSRTILVIVLALVVIFACLNMINPLLSTLTDSVGLSTETATICVIVALTLLLLVAYHFIRKVLDVIFSWEQQQDKVISDFSLNIGKSLNVGEILKNLINTITTEIPSDGVYICLVKGDGFESVCAEGMLDQGTFRIEGDSPCLIALEEADGCLILEEFNHNPLYQSMWQNERSMLEQMHIGCMLSLKDQNGLVGLVMITEKERNGKFTYPELTFLRTITSISAIAIKNAMLYEQVFKEARIDSLTGAYNYRYFVEQIRSQFDACRDTSLALLYIDIDDFKLYNQLYGAAEGDRALVEVANILNQCVGENGMIFRSSGKVFAILMPGYDGRHSEQLAEEIQKRTAEINTKPGRTHMKPITISCGICISPYSASTPKELMENADLAVFHAKEAGKKAINRYETGCKTDESPMLIASRVAKSTGDSSYQENLTTIKALTAAIDAKDHYTYQHSKNVARYACTLAAAYGLGEDELRMIYEAGLLHDIGKISIPETVLGKTEHLNAAEYETMKKHVNNSIDIIRHLSSMDYLIPAVVGHHERWDGKGYPRGIHGNNIPLSARCLAIADAFDAMTTTRPYRKALPLEYASDQIELGAGTQFDPELAILFVNLIKAGEIKLKEE